MFLEIDPKEESLGKIKKSLIVKPYVPDEYISKEYKVYSIKDGKCLVPAFFPFKTKPGTKLVYNDGTPCDIKFTKELRDYQSASAEIVYKHLIDKHSGLCCVYTGWGKTCLALWIASKLKVKTLIVVHTGALLEQWRERISFFTDEEAGIYRQDQEDTLSNIVIATVQSLVRRNYYVDQFGLLIIDETHLYPTQSFKDIFYQVPTKYMLGLTATLKRKDRLDTVVKWFMGDVIINIELLEQKVSVRLDYYYQENPPEELINKAGKLNQSKMLTELCANKDRTKYLLDIINNCLLEDRKILVLSHRRNHCEYIHKQLGNNISGLYLGGMSNDELLKTNEKRVILATYNMASMGYDNPSLDTLIFASPRSTIKQCVGRIIRKKNKNHPLVIDIVDPYSFYTGLFNQRMRYYRKSKFIVNTKDDTTNGLSSYNHPDKTKLELDKCLL